MWCHSNGSLRQKSWCKVPDDLTEHDSGDVYWWIDLVRSCQQSIHQYPECIKTASGVSCWFVWFFLKLERSSLWGHKTNQQELGDSFRSEDLTWTKVPVLTDFRVSLQQAMNNLGACRLRRWKQIQKALSQESRELTFFLSVEALN